MGCIRNHFFAGGLWFLSCLFVIKVVFYALRRFIRFKWILLLISLGLYCIAELVISHCPLADPRMPFNVDSACYYTVFYALGYVCFNPIKRLLRADTTAKRVTCTTLGVLTLVGGIPWALSHGRRLISGGHSHTVGDLISGLLCPLVMILLVLLLSKLLEEADLFADLGRDTLYLCGSEYLVKLLVPICLQTVGLDLVLPDPIAAFVYTIALLLICHKTLVPFEKMILKKLRIIK
jgi:fucose 4-O-acetylase-like acetyltransferase